MAATGHRGKPDADTAEHHRSKVRGQDGGQGEERTLALLSLFEARIEAAQSVAAFCAGFQEQVTRVAKHGEGPLETSTVLLLLLNALGPRLDLRGTLREEVLEGRGVAGWTLARLVSRAIELDDSSSSSSNPSSMAGVGSRRVLEVQSFAAFRSINPFVVDVGTGIGLSSPWLASLFEPWGQLYEGAIGALGWLLAPNALLAYRMQTRLPGTPFILIAAHWLVFVYSTLALYVFRAHLPFHPHSSSA